MSISSVQDPMKIDTKPKITLRFIANCEILAYKVEVCLWNILFWESKFRSSHLSAI